MKIKENCKIIQNQKEKFLTRKTKQKTTTTTTTMMMLSVVRSASTTKEQSKLLATNFLRRRNFSLTTHSYALSLNQRQQQHYNKNFNRLVISSATTSNKQLTLDVFRFHQKAFFSHNSLYSNTAKAYPADAPKVFFFFF